MARPSHFFARLAAGLSQCLLLCVPVLAFNTSQHRDSTAQAIAAAGEDAADIRKFGGTIRQWSGGLCALNPLKFTCTPAEELAHAKDQRANFCTIADNGGPFEAIHNSIVPRYSQTSIESLNGMKPGEEGAYVFMGAAIHLIEDQASMPHGANVRHGECPTGVLDLYSWYREHDNFEGWNKTNGELTRVQGNFEPEVSYIESLRVTQRVVPNVLSRQFTPPLRPWLTNLELFATGDRDVSNTTYVGQWPVTSDLFGKYGGPGNTDIYEDANHPQLYYEQGSQATDFAYHFLLNISKDLPPIFSKLYFCESYNADGICSFERALGPGRLNSANGTDIVLVIAENRAKRVFVDAFVRQAESEIPLVTTGATVVLGKEDSPLAIPQSRTLEGGLAWAGLPIDLHPTSDSNLNLLPFKAEIRLPFHGLVQGATLTEGSHEFCVRVRDTDGNVSEERCGNFILDNTPPSWLSCNSAEKSTDGKYDVDARDSLSGVKSIDVETADGQKTTSGPSQPAATVTQTIGPLASGKHRLTLRDAVGNSSDCFLDVERNPVRIQVARSGQIVADTLTGLTRSASPIPASGDFSFTAQSVLGPISRLEVLRGGSPVIDKGPAASDADSIFATLPGGEPAGAYIVRAKDAAGRSVETTFTTVDTAFRVIREESVADFDPVSKKFKPRLVLEAESTAGLSHIGLRHITTDGAQVEVERKAVSGTSARTSFGPLDPEKTYLAVAETAAGDLLALRLSFFTTSNGSGAGEHPYHWNIPVGAAGATLTNTIRFANPPTGSVNVPCTSATEQCVKLAAAGEGFSAEGTFLTGVKEIQSPIESATRLLLGGALTIREPGADGSGFCSHFAGHAEPYAVDYLGDMVSGTSPCVTSGPTSSLKIRTGDSAANLGAEVSLVTERYDFQPGWITSVSDDVVTYWRSFLQTRECPGAEVIPLGRYVQAEFRLTHSPNASRLCGRADDPPSDSPVVGSRAGKYGLIIRHDGFAPNANWLFVDVEASPAIAPQLLVRAGPSAHISIPGVGDFDFSDVTSPGSLSARPGPVRVPPGYATKQANSGTHVDSDAVYDAIDITLPIDPSVYHPSQLERLVILHITNEVTGAYENITTARGPSYIKGRTTSLSPFIVALPTAALAVPIVSGRLVEARPEATITASNESLALVEVDTTTAEGATFLAAKSAEGYSLVGTAYRTNPPSVALLGDARLLMRYSTAAILEANLDPASALIANFELGTSRFELPPQASDTAEAAISLNVGSAAGGYGVFARPRDRQAPATRLATRGPFFRDGAGRLFVSTSALLGFEGTDSGTLVGLPSGYRRTYFKVEPSPSLVAGGLSAGTAHLFEVFADSVALAGGSRTIAFGGVDFAGNFEPLQVVDVFVDFTPPASLLLIDDAPAPFQSGTLPILRSSAVAFAVADPGAPAVGPGGLEYSLDNGSWAGFEEPLGGLSTGTHVLRFRAVDLVENREEIREVTLDVRPFADTTPPVTRVVAVGARFLAADGREFLSTETLLNLKAYDSYGREGPPSGVAEVLYSVEGASETNGEVRYSQPFSLPEGASLLRFGARDTAGNSEIFGSSAVLVDGTPPLSVPLITGSSTTNSTGSPIVGLDTLLAIESTDPVSNGVAAGIAATLFLLDPGPDFCGLSPEALPVAISTAPQGSCANPYFIAASTLGAGEHHIAFLPVDNVGILGVLTTSSIHVDANPPSRVTDLVMTAAGDFSLTLAWTAPDDEVAGVGLYRLWYATVPFDESTLSLALPARDPPTPLAPGSRQEAVIDGLEPATTYFFAVAAVDRVANQASLSLPLPAATRLPDRTPPITTQSLDGFSASLDGVLYLSTATSIVLSASDAVPPPGQSARGVSAVYYAVDPPSSLIDAGLSPDTTAQFSVYPGSFTLAEGARTLAFGAADNAGNYEPLHVASFTVVRLEDHDAPTTRLVAFGTTAVLGADLAVTAGSLLSLVASDDLPAIGAAGVGTTRLRLNGIETPYSAPFTLPSGSHTLTYWSIDRAGNLETPTNLTVIVPPGVLGENFALSFGGFGSATGKLNQPADVAVDASGNLFVSDNRNWRVQKFSSTGVFLLSFGSKGTGPGQFGDNFSGPQSLTVSKANGNVLAIDRANRRLQEFSPAGAFIRTIVGSPTFSFGSLSVDTDSEGNVYVMDDGNQRVYRFTSSGQQVAGFVPAPGTFMSDMAVGFNGIVHIVGANGGMHVVQRYALSGELLSQWPGIDPNLFQTFDNAGTLIKIYDQNANKVAVDLQGNVFVGDDKENSVRIYSSAGGFIAKFGPNSGPSGTLSGVAGLAVDAGSGKAYVADYSLHVVKGYSPRTVAAPSAVADLSLALQPDGTLAAQWTAPGAEGGVGTAAVYELRQSTVEITVANYSAAALVGGLPAPAPPGTVQTAVVDGLSGGATVYLALRTYNSGGAVSEISNVPGVPVPFIGRSDVKIGPRPEVIILSGIPLTLVKLEAAGGAGADVRVAAASVSLTAVSGVYDLLPNGPLPTVATGFITIQVDATRAAGFAEGELGMYTFEGGAMIRLPGQTYDADLARFTAHLTTAAPIGVFGPVEDVLAPVTRLEVESGAALFLAEGGYLVAGTSRLRLSSSDPISKSTASGVASTVFSVNGGALTDYEEPFALPEGRNTVRFNSTDYAGNSETPRSSAVLVDASAPRAHLVIRQSTGVIEGNEVVSATALFDLVGIDPTVNEVAAGVDSVEASLDGAPFAPSTAPFSLLLGAGELAIRARDRVGNLSAEGRVTLSKPPWPAKGYAFSGKFGSKGALDSQFSQPAEIAIDVAGDFYVSDSSKLRVFKFSKNGQFQFSFGGSGTGPGKFGSTFGQFGLATVLDSTGNLFVTDNGNRRVQKFSSDGQFLTQISTDPETGQFYFGSISDLALDRDGNLWVLSSFRNLVKFAPSGEFLGSFSLGLVSGENAYSFVISPDDSIIVQVERFSAPFEVFRVYDRDIQFLRQWNSPTNHTPIVSGTDFFGNVVAVVGSPRRVNIYTPTGALLTTLGTGGPSGQNVAGAGGAAVDKLTGRVYISDAFEGDVKYFDVDQVAPEPPIVASPPPNAVLRTFSPTIVGRAEGASLVTILEGAAILASTRVPTDGMFQVRVPNLPKGLHALRLTAQDRSGNVSAAAFVQFDTQYPNPASFGGWSTATVTSGLYPGIVKAVEPADFDLDGRQDLLAFGRNGYALFRGMPNGSFTPVSGKQFSSLLDDCSSAASGDINGDTFPDIVAVCRYDSTRLVALLGTGTTTLGTEQLIHLGTGWSRIALTDWNRDDKLDIIGVGPEGGLYVLYGQGGGVFQTPTTLLTSASGSNFALADLDADGLDDIVLANRVLFGDGQGGVAQTVTLAGIGLQPIVGDFNGDGQPDLWIAAPGRFSAFLNLGARGFVALTTGTAGYGGLALPEAADLNRDGLVDGFLEGRQFVPAAGDGGPGVAQFVVPDTGGQVLLLDADGDGLLDIVQAANQSSLASLFIYRNLSGQPDVTPPAAITDLVVTSPLAGTLELSWTAPGDDGQLGTATRYDIKFASYPIDADNFDAVQNPAIRDNFPAPAAAGTRQTAKIGGYDANKVNFQALPIGATYHVRIRASDEVEQTALDAAAPSAQILGSDLAISSSQVRFVVNEGTLELYACPENRGPAISPTGEIAIVAGPSSGTPTDLAGPYYSDAGFHFIPLGDCRQGTRFQYLDAGDEALRSFPVVRGQREFGVYLRHYPIYVPPGLDPDPTNDFVHLTVGIGEDGQIDNTAPAPVTDLVAELLVDGQVRLTWTAPGDDALTGTAKSYEIRSSSVSFSASEFESQSVAAASVPATASAGEVQSRLISGFPLGTTVFFALRAFDDADNPAKPSNLAQAETPFIAASPAPEGSTPELTFVSSRPVTVEPIVEASTTGTVILAAAGEQGLTPASGLFEIGPDGAFEPAATLVFRYSTATLAALGLAEEDIAVYEFFGGQGWVRLANQTLDAVNGRIVVSLSSIASQFGIFGVLQDREAPTTALRASGGVSYEAPDGTVFRSSAVLYGFLAEDPVIHSTSTGVAFTEYRIGASTDTPFQRFTADFVLAEGRNLVAFRSQDNAGNLEVERSSNVLVDATPPVTILRPGAAFYAAEAADGPRSFAAARTSYTFETQDPVEAEVASGVGETFLALGTAPLQAAPTAFALSEGVRLLTYGSRDHVGNAELLNQTTVYVDGTAPATTLSASGPSALLADGLTLAVSSRTALALTASDPEREGVASGVRETLLGLDTTTLSAQAGTFVLSEPRPYLLHFRSVDNVSNEEEPQTAAVVVDTAPPSIAIAAPAAGDRYVARAAPILISFSALDAYDPAPSSSAFLVRLLDRGSPAGGRPDVVAVRNGQTIEALDLDDGVWELRLSATDFVLNSAAASGGAFEVLHDVLPPRTSLVVGQPSAEGAPEGALFVTGATELALQSSDDLVALDDGIGLGVARQDLSVDGVSRGAFVSPDSSSPTFRSTFTLQGDADGLRLLTFSGTDVLANAESVRVATVAVDNTAPLTSLAVAGGRQIPAGEAGAFYASTDTVYALPATDPVSGGVAAGLDATFRKLGEGATATAASTFTLSEGRNALAYWSRDRLGNLEVIRSTTALVDGTPPVSAALVGDPSFIDEGGVRYVSSSTLVALSAQDPALPDGTAGSSFDRIELSLGDGPFAAYTSSLTFAEGRRLLRWRALDRVGNLEEARSLELRSDASAPETSLVVLGGRQAPGPDAGSFYASSDTRFALPAADPVVAEVTSGFDSTRWRDNDGPLQAYAVPFTLDEGTHLLSYGSVDRVANAEILRSTTILIDATAPRTDFALGTPSFVDADGTRYVTPATSVTFTAQDPALPGGTAGSGLARIEVSVDGADFVEYSAALAFPEGRHMVSFRALDRVGNVEAAQTLALRSDASSPLTSLALQGGRQASGPDAVSFYASLDTRFALPALDPVVAEAASGLESTSWQDNGGAFQTYSAPIALAEGSHLLAYRSLDHVANLEVLRSTTVLVDATAPRSSFTIGAPSFMAADGTRYVAPGTQVSFAAEDPTLPGGPAGSGVERIEVAVDGGAYQTYSAALTFDQGRHTVLFRAVDRVGNVEATQTLALRSDATPPVTALVASGAYYPSEGRDYAPANFTYTLPAQDPVTADVASGVAETLYAIDTAPMQSFTAPFSLMEGVRVVTAQSRDNVANPEQPRGSTVHVDAAPPQTSLAVQGGRQAPGPDVGGFYASSDTRFALAALDPVVSGVASGVDFTRWQDNGGVFAAFAAPIALGEGTHVLAYQAQDHVGNLEVLRSTTVLIDATPPQTAFQIGSPAIVDADGTRYVTPATPVSFSAQDAALPGGGAGSGVERIEVSVDGAPYATYAAAITLSEGRHLVSFRALDRVGNMEAAQTLALRSDASSPRTSLAIQGGRQVAGPDSASFYASLDTRFALPALDPVVAEVASGLESTSWQDNGGAFQTSGEPLALSEGAHLLAYRSRDRVQNLEVLLSTTALIDATPPVTAFQLSSPSYMDETGVHYVTPTTPVTFSATDPALPGGAVGAGVERIEVAVDGGPFQAYSTALSFEQGRHTVLFRSVDRVGNVEAERILALRSDAAAPETSLAVQGGKQAPGPDAASFYASPDTRYALPAADPIVADVTSGVDLTRWRDGEGAFQTYSAPIALAEGSHLLAYQSLDHVANLEVLRSTTVLVDATAPRSSFTISAPSFVAADGTRYVAPGTKVAFSAEDPAPPGGPAGSGVERIEVAVDGGAYQTYSSGLSFNEGRPTVQFRSVDRVGNVEAAQTLALRSDATPPVTALVPSGAYYSSEGRDYAPANFTYALPAQDPVTADVASGVAETLYAIDTATMQAFTAPFTVAEGVRVVTAQSRDNVANLEQPRASTVYVDASAPQTSLAVQGGRQAPGPNAGSFYASSDSRFSLAALDPVVSGVASGVDFTRWQDNSGAFAAFAAPIALGEGAHVLTYQAQDHVGNLEVLRSTTVFIDAAPPQTAFQIGSPAFVDADGTRYVTPATPVSFSAQDAAFPGGAAGSGVERIEVSVDGAPYATYSAALTLTEGRHVLSFRSVDRVGNVEAAQTLALRSDSSAPLTSLAAQGGRQVAGPEANSFYASLDTRFALPAADPVVSDVAAGVAATRWQDNGGALQAYGSPIALVEGSHLLAYQSQDKVQNLEVLRSTTVRIDATAPLTAFNIGAPAYTDAGGVHYVTPTTPVTFTAQDPALPGGTAGSGVERIEVALDAANFQTYSAALTFAEGRHSIRFRAYDKVGNVEAERTLEVRSDASAPLSSLAVQGGRQTAGPDAASQYASADTRIALSASDPLVADVASGVELIRWQDNGGAFQTYSAPLALAEGRHILAYQGQDKVQNVETLRSTTVLVDATAPRTAFQIGTPAFIDPSGTRYLTPTTPVTFTAEDPALPGGAAGAGLERIEVAVDGGAFVTYAAALTFPEGRHTVQFRAADRVGNVEAAQTLALRSDASAPLTSLDIQGGRQAAGPNAATFYASSATRYALPATDPVVADVASGVEFTRWQDNGGSLMSYSGPIAFPEGVHALTYASEDRVRNVEAQKGATALVDATPPITQFSLNGPRYAHAAGDQSVGGELFVSPVTGIELATLDPVSNGVASGFERLLASVDGGPFLPWVGAISFAQEGYHAVAYRGADRVGNEEGTRSVSVAVDATAPSTMLTFDGPALVRGPGATWEPQQAEAFITPVTKVILNTNDPTSAGIAAGVKLTRFRIDSGPWQVYRGFFYLSNQGLHLVEFAAEDRVGNVETLVAKRIAVDNTAPLVSAAINGSWLEAFGLNLLSTAATVSLAANDSSVAGVAVGLARILYRIDDGGLLEYTAPFAMGPGSHTVRYQAVDLLGNTGSPQTLSVSVLRFLGGSLAAKGAINGSGNGQVTGLLQTDAALSLTGNVSATGGADAFSISLKGNATLTGPTTQGVKPLSSDSIDLAAIQAALSAANDNAGLPPGSLSGGVLRVSGNQTVTLGTGSYLLSGLELSGNAKLLVSGPVRLFVTGPVRLSGNAALNEAGPARNMAIFGTAASAQLSAAALSAVVYLPSASFEISGNLRLGGSALAASVTLSGNSNATTPGLDGSAPAEVTAGGGQGGSKLASASTDGGLLLASGPLDTTFVLRDIYAFPNPAVRGQRPVLHAAVGIADKVTIRLYDIAGQPVHAATIDSAPQVIDDGSGPKYAYEYVWDGHIPSGVYLYVVVAEKNGHAPIKRVGKLAVVR